MIMILFIAVGTKTILFIIMTTARYVIVGIDCFDMWPHILLLCRRTIGAERHLAGYGVRVQSVSFKFCEV